MESPNHHHHRQQHALITPEKLALLKLNNGALDSDALSDAGTVNAYRSADYTILSPGAARSGLTRSSRRQSSMLRSSSYMESSSYSKISSELIAQAESKFMVLMEVVANASKEATSLKTIWERMIHERETFLREHESLLTQTTELTTELRTREEERSRHGTAELDRKKQVDTLLAELTVALASATTEKERIAERDAELARINTELRETRDSIRSHSAQYERTREALETLTVRLKTAEAERDSAREVSERYHRELNRASRDRTEIATKLSEITSSFETSQTEILSLSDRLNVAELEREEGRQTTDRLEQELKRVKQKSIEDSKEAIEATEKYDRVFREVTRIKETLSTIEIERDEGLQTVDRLKEELKRAKQKSIEDSKEAVEAIEKHDRVSREITRIKETLSIVEIERDEHLHTSQSLRRQINNHVLENDELTGRFGDVTKKYEAAKRELATTRESLRSVELARHKDVEALERTRESLYSVTRERDELSDELITVNKRLDEQRQQSTSAHDNLHHVEQTLSEVRIELTTLNEKLIHVQRERDDARDKHGHGLTELNHLRERIGALEQENRSIIESRSELSIELERLRSDYTEVTETITTFHDDTEEMEQEIETLRALLRETREQRERAVGARDSADKERDEYISRYEEKCREVERFKESSFSRNASHSHSHGHSHNHSSGSGGAGEIRTSRTITTRSASHMDQSSGAHQISHASSSGARENSHISSSDENHASNSEAAREFSTAA